MKSYSKHARKLVVTCCGAALAMGLFVFRAQGDPWDKKTIMTIDKTIQVTDTVLPAGTYVFKLADSSSNRHIVQIFNKDQSHIINTILAIPNYRLRPTGRSQFLFYETPAGAAPALRAWFYPGDNFGQEFAYPKHLAMLQQTTQTTESSRMTKQESEANRETETKTEEADRSAVESTPAPQQMAEATPPPPPAEQPVEMAQNTPPPAPAPAETPRQLPKTASPYPWIGLAGMLSLTLYGALRIKRSA